MRIKILTLCFLGLWANLACAIVAPRPLPADATPEQIEAYREAQARCAEMHRSQNEQRAQERATLERYKQEEVALLENFLKGPDGGAEYKSAQLEETLGGCLHDNKWEPSYSFQLLVRLEALRQIHEEFVAGAREQSVISDLKKLYDSPKFSLEIAAVKLQESEKSLLEHFYPYRVEPVDTMRDAIGISSDELEKRARVFRSFQELEAVLQEAVAKEKELGVYAVNERLQKLRLLQENLKTALSRTHSDLMLRLRPEIPYETATKQIKDLYQLTEAATPATDSLLNRAEE